MATYVIGDIQGCLPALEALLQQCRFDPAIDHLVLAGDLVARGPDSLGTLRFVRQLGSCATTVLGNHDLNLLAVAAGQRKVKDGLQTVLDAPDAADLLHWLRQQSMAWQDPTSGTLVVHAGVPAAWTAAETLGYASEVEALLRNDSAWNAFVPLMYGDEPSQWHPELLGSNRLRFIVNALTRMRYCRPDGACEFKHKGAPGTQAPGLKPWFTVAGRRTQSVPIVFGHWSTLNRMAWPTWNVFCIDTGCVWGGPLTALRIDDMQLIQCQAPQSLKSGS